MREFEWFRGNLRGKIGRFWWKITFLIGIFVWVFVIVIFWSILWYPSHFIFLLQSSTGVCKPCWDLKILLFLTKTGYFSQKVDIFDKSGYVLAKLDIFDNHLIFIVKNTNFLVKWIFSTKVDIFYKSGSLLKNWIFSRNCIFLTIIWYCNSTF